MSDRMNGHAPKWPEPMKAEAFAGLAGLYVAEVSRGSEVDPAAALLTFLVAFGAMVGPGPYAKVRADEHRANLFGMIGGDSALGAKGESWSPLVDVIAGQSFPGSDGSTWGGPRIINGLGSGEGLIHALRDKEPEREVGKGKAARVVEGGGTNDKRAIIFEPEMSRLLKAAGREGSTITDQLRAAWDGRDLGSVLSGRDIQVTRPHVSAVFHLTPAEGRDLFKRRDLVNGFGNRILFAMSRRQGSVPNPEPLGGPSWTVVVAKVYMAAREGRHVCQYARSREADELWAEWYEGLKGAGFVQGSIVSEVLHRGAPQLLRLSLIYALLDGANAIEVTHLRSARAVLDYCRLSVMYLFGDEADVDLRERVFAFIEASNKPVSKRDIFALNRNRSADEYNLALRSLESAELIQRVESDSLLPRRRGRPAELWEVVP